MTSPAFTPVFSSPEPELTPEELMRRAEAMRDVLRERQLACEEAGEVSQATNNEFVKAGFYRILQPRCFGGYEFDLPVFIRVMMAVSRGCPESGWVLALTAGHAFVMAMFPEAGQLEAFADEGEFRAPSVAMPGGSAVRVDGGYQVKGAWDYASGCDLATHFIGSTMVHDPRSPMPVNIWVLFDRNQYEVIDNWHVIGMQGTGSRRVVIEETFVPEHRVIQMSTPAGTRFHDYPGRRLHGNPLYQGRVVPLLISELASVAVGAARGALDIYEEILRRKKYNYSPFQLLFEKPEYQHYFGQAQAWVDTAEAALMQVGSDYMDRSRRGWTDEAERRLLAVEQQCVRLAWDAVDLMFRTAGSSSAAKTAPLGRYFRNLAVIRTHITQQYDHTAMNAARLHLGLGVTDPL